MVVKKEKQPGTREQNSQGRDPRTREQRRAKPTAGEVYNETRGETRGSITRGEERNTVLQVRKQRQAGQQQQEV